jgi:hypothetical protein
MSMLEVIKQLAGETLYHDHDPESQCPACRYWADKPDGKPCQYANWRSSIGTVYCTELRLKDFTTAQINLSSRR